MKVAYQGIKGAYSQIAISYLLKDRKVEPIGVSTFEKIFELVLKKKCKYGLVPLENSLAGSIHQNYDLLAKHDLKIVGEIYLRISHNLLVIPKPEIKNKNKRLKVIKKVYSHSQALLQCQEFFKNHPWIKALPAEDTAGSAKDLAEQKSLDVAAIASSEAARTYGLEVLEKAIETNKNNFTRFVLIGEKQDVSETNEASPPMEEQSASWRMGGSASFLPRSLGARNKVSLIFSVPHVPGSLYKSLEPFAKRKINLTKIESRPIIGKLWEYLFYLDFEIGSAKEKCLKAIRKLKKYCLYLKILGFYKKGETKP